jgi:hypothetical protein
MHIVDDGHETDVVPFPMSGLPAVQLVPFQPSANGASEAYRDPTATHAVVEGHETLFSMNGLVIGLGGACSVQLLPSQCSIAPKESTASHQTPDAHETATSGGSVSVTAGVGWIAQRVPFQDSARITPLPEVAYEPTATQSVGDGHATEVNRTLPPGGGTTVSAVQSTPFQNSATGSPEELKPTAMQATVEAHDTLMRSDGAPAKALKLRRVPCHVNVSSDGVFAPAAAQKLAEGQEIPFHPPRLDTVTSG